MHEDALGVGVELLAHLSVVEEHRGKLLPHLVRGLERARGCKGARGRKEMQGGAKGARGREGA